MLLRVLLLLLLGYMIYVIFRTYRTMRKVKENYRRQYNESREGQVKDISAEAKIIEERRLDENDD